MNMATPHMKEDVLQKHSENIKMKVKKMNATLMRNGLPAMAPVPLDLDFEKTGEFCWIKQMGHLVIIS